MCRPVTIRSWPGIRGLVPCLRRRSPCRPRERLKSITCLILLRDAGAHMKLQKTLISARNRSARRWISGRRWNCRSHNARSSSPILLIHALYKEPIVNLGKHILRMGLVAIISLGTGAALGYDVIDVEHGA